VAIVTEANRLEEPMDVPPGVSRFRTFLPHPGAVFGLTIIVLQVFFAVFAPWVTPHDPTQTYPDTVLAGPSGRFWFGTDELGRDILSRVIYGARVSLQIAVIVVGIAATVGSLLGLLAGVLLALLRRLSDLDFGAGLTLIATVQEEFSMRAGVPAVRAVDPDVLICLDIALAADSPGHNTDGPRLGEGPVVHGYTRGRTGGGLIPNPRLVRYITDTAQEHAIPFVRGTLSGGLTDGSYMQYAGAGIPTIDLAFPVRNAHTAVEVADLRDVEHLVDLLAHAITGAERGLTFARG